MQQAAHPWEESRGMGYSYGYNRMETLADYHSDRELLMMLLDIVARGGNLLLDIGPTGDGRIPVVMEERLIQIGDFLRPNGEAIYGTHARKTPRQWSKGSIPKLEEKEFMSDYDITKLVDTPPSGYARVEAFYTVKNDAVYAILPRRPIGEVVLDDIEAPSGVTRHAARRRPAIGIHAPGKATAHPHSRRRIGQLAGPPGVRLKAGGREVRHRPVTMAGLGEGAGRVSEVWQFTPRLPELPADPPPEA